MTNSQFRFTVRNLIIVKGYSSVVELPTADREVPGSKPGVPCLAYLYCLSMDLLYRDPHQVTFDVMLNIIFPLRISFKTLFSKHTKCIVVFSLTHCMLSSESEIKAKNNSRVHNQDVTLQF